jgi:Lon protease-like protein
MIATISDGLYALLVTGGCFALVVLVVLIQPLQPARLRSWRDQREVKRRVLAELERRQEEQLDRMRDTTGATHNEAFVRYLELQNSIEVVKRT